MSECEDKDRRYIDKIRKYMWSQRMERKEMEVLKYLNESKKAVIVAQGALKSIIDVLNLEGV